MTSCSENLPELRRARPFLGTVVEIAVPSTSDALGSLEHAFARIARVHALMSAHDQTSDLGRLQAAAVGESVRVHPWTWRVLAAALRLNRLTAGAFDPVAAGRLALARGDLPIWPGREPARASGCTDIELLSLHRVRLRRALRIDLGGIAKGFAVDQAVRSLKRDGLPWGLVNAGGDLRAFGSRAWPIHTRHPAHPTELVSLGMLWEGAIATSAPYFSERMNQGQSVSALANPHTGRSIVGAISATVFAPTCLVADALTKAVLLNRAAHALRACRARAIILALEENARHAA